MVSHIKRERSRMVGLLIIFSFFLAACDRWGTEEEATILFEESKSDFVHMRDLIVAHDALKRVDPELEADNAGLPRYKEFNSEDTRIYNVLNNEVERLQLLLIQIVRDESSNDLTLSTIVFFVFGRGIAGDTEAITISYWPDQERYKKFQLPNRTCSKLSEVGWYVCRTE